MNMLSKLWAALARLTNALDAAAETVERANATARGRLGLDEPDDAEVLAVTPAAPALPAPGPADEPAPANGRARKARAAAR